MTTQKTQERSDTILFMRRVSVFCLPLLLLLAFPMYVFILSGEGMSTSSVIAAQKESVSPVLFGAAYGNSTAYYKLHYLFNAHPAVVALGTSRVMQFRSGGSINRIEKFREFLDKIPHDSSPAILLIGLDQNLFNPDLRRKAPLGIDELAEFDSPLGVFFNSWPAIYRDFFQRKFTLAELTRDTPGRRVIGLNALRNDNGFRNDGSYRYGYFLSHPDEQAAVYSKIRHFDRRDTDEPRLRPSVDTLDEAAIRELVLFLNAAALRGIHVAGFLPPYPPAVYAELSEDRTSYPYIFALPGRLRALFTPYHFSFFDFSDSAAFGSRDAEMLDILHGSEKTYARLFLKMAATDAKLAPYAAVADIERHLRTATSTFTLFPD